jgi:hypothetical protein
VGDDVVELSGDPLALLGNGSICGSRDSVGLEPSLLLGELPRAGAVPGGDEAPNAVSEIHRGGR